MTDPRHIIELAQGGRATVPPAAQTLITVISGEVEVYAVSDSGGGERHVAFLTTITENMDILPPPAGSGYEYGVFALRPVVLETRTFGSLETSRLSNGISNWYAKVLPSRHDDANGGDNAGLEELGRKLGIHIGKLFEAEDRQFGERSANDEKRKTLLMAGAFVNLLHAENTDIDDAVETSGDLHDPASRVLRIMARHFGLQPSDQHLSPELAARLDPIARLRRLADKSRIRLRLVILPPGWEKTEIGPIIGYHGPERMLSAFLPQPKGRYALFRGDDFSSVTVTAEVAKEVYSEAFACYSDPPENDAGPWAAFLSILRRSWSRDWRIICLVSLLASLLPLTMPLITETIFSDIIPINDRQALGTVAQVMLVSGFVSVTLVFVRAVSCVRLKCRVGVDLEAALWSRLLRLPVRFFRDYQVGDLVNRMQGSAFLGALFDSAFTSGLFGVVTCTWSLALMLYYSVRMTLFAIFAWAVYLGVSWVVYRRVLEYQTRAVKTANKTIAIVLQLMEGIPVFRLRGAEERSFLLWSQAFGEGWKWNLALRRQANRAAIIDFVQPIALTALIFFLASRIFGQTALGPPVNLTYAQFLAFYGLFGEVTAFLLAVAPVVTAVYGIKPHLENLRPIFETKPESVENKADAGLLSGRVEGKNLCFRYIPGGPEVISDVTFTVRPGETVAFVGTSGCGKSTLVRLLLGFEKPESGGVFYDGLDLAALDPGSVRSQIGTVLQNGRLTAGDIFTNIVGTLPLVMDDAWEAARMVGLAEDIQKMPMGMHTMISEGGSNLSGGQRQRVLLARSFVNHPRIMILDEATSSLDNATQAIVTQSLDRLKTTRIVIAHRLSTIKNANHIYVMDRGRIVEEGTYDNLMALNGWFTRLASRQME